jgi:hypothetical protein
MNTFKKISILLLSLLVSSAYVYGQETLKAWKAENIQNVRYDNKASSMAPANDNYSAAVVLNIGSPALAGTTAAATLETNEVMGCNTAANQTVWYRITSTSAITYIIVITTDSCSVGTVTWPALALPVNRCTMLDCQGSGNGPDTTVFKIAGAAGATYAVQVTYTSGNPCSSFASFTIRAANSYSGEISNPGPVNSCPAATPGCYFTSTPTISNVISTCPADSLSSQVNLVNHQYYTFTTPATDSYILNFNNIIQSTCSTGNVLWFFWRLYDSSCNVLTCGDTDTTTAIVSCDSTYILEYMWEELPCTYTVQWPYMYAPTGTVGCNASTTVSQFQNSDLSIFPNPVSDFIQVSKGSTQGENLRADIFDARGTFIFSTDNTSIIDVRRLSTGIYAVKIISSDGKLSLNRFVKY